MPTGRRNTGAPSCWARRPTPGTGAGAGVAMEARKRLHPQLQRAAVMPLVEAMTSRIFFSNAS